MCCAEEERRGEERMERSITHFGNVEDSVNQSAIDHLHSSTAVG